MQDSRDIIPILWNNRKLIIGATFLSMVIAAGLSLILPNYYKATSLFYPVSEELQRPIVDAKDDQLSFFGNDHDVDRLLSIAQSREIKQRIIEEFKLIEHYGIDPDDRKAQLKVTKKVDKLYEALKTKLDAIEISVEDQDPELAAQICNRIRELIEEKALELTEGARNQLIKSMTEEITGKEKELVEMTAQIRTSREKYGIYDTESQAEGLATLQANSPNSASVKSTIDKYVTGVSEIKKLEIQQEELAKIITKDRNQLKQLSASQNREISAIHVIEVADVPLEKSRPKRSLIVLGMGLLAGLFSSLLVLVRRSISGLDFSVK